MELQLDMIVSAITWGGAVLLAWGAVLVLVRWTSAHRNRSRAARTEFRGSSPLPRDRGSPLPRRGRGLSIQSPFTRSMIFPMCVELSMSA
jgi:hypothetical protein